MGAPEVENSCSTSTTPEKYTFGQTVPNVYKDFCLKHEGGLGCSSSPSGKQAL